MNSPVKTLANLSIFAWGIVSGLAMYWANGVTPGPWDVGFFALVALAYTGSLVVVMVRIVKKYQRLEGSAGTPSPAQV